MDKLLRERGCRLNDVIDPAGSVLPPPWRHVPIGHEPQRHRPGEKLDATSAQLSADKWRGSPQRGAELLISFNCLASLLLPCSEIAVCYAGSGFCVIIRPIGKRLCL